MGCARTGGPWLFLLVVALSFFGRAVAQAQSAGCNRAQSIVDAVRAKPKLTDDDHRAALARLETAKSLCPSLGEIWRLAYCSASALGLETKANTYRKRATLSLAGPMNCVPQGQAGEAEPAPLLGPVRQKFALLVGISRFADSAIPALRYSAKDAKDLARFLVEKGHFPAANVFLLTDEEASRVNILDRLNSLILRAEPDDLVTIFLSSHGSPHRPGQGLGGIGYLVTHDSALDRIWIDGIEYADFSRKVSLIRARRTVTFLDTCYSGQSLPAEGAKQLAIGGVGIDQQTAEMFLSGEGDYVMTSSRGDERSWESDALENGYFTHYLIEALSQGETPPTIRQVFERLSFKVSKAVAEEKGVGQHPQLHPIDGSGDLKLGVRPSTLGQ